MSRSKTFLVNLILAMMVGMSKTAKIKVLIKIEKGTIAKRVAKRKAKKKTTKRKASAKPPKRKATQTPKSIVTCRVCRGQRIVAVESNVFHSYTFKKCLLCKGTGLMSNDDGTYNRR